MEEKIKKIMAAVLELGQSDINNDTNPDTVSNWDSLRHMKLVFALEEEFAVEFSDDQIFRLTNIGSIMDCVKEIV